MRTYQGIPVESLPPSNSAEFTPRLRDMLATLDLWARDASRGFGRIQQGLVPNGSGQTIIQQTPVDLSDYLYLPGRISGQIIHAVDDSPTVAIQAIPAQSADLQQWRSSTGLVMGAVNSDGSAYFSNNGTSFAQLSSNMLSSTLTAGFIVSGNNLTLRAIAGPSITFGNTLSDVDGVFKFSPAGSTTFPVVVVKSPQFQTATLQEWRAFGGTMLSAIQADGAMLFGTAAASTPTGFVGAGGDVYKFIGAASAYEMASYTTCSSAAAQLLIRNKNNSTLKTSGLTLEAGGTTAAARYASLVTNAQTDTTDDSFVLYIDKTSKYFGTSDSVSTFDYLINFPRGLAATINWTLPTTQGSANTVLRNNGSGTLSWSASSGSSNLTAQMGSIASQTLITGTAGTAGVYRISAYLKTTTAGNVADVVKMTASWNDGTAQTIVVPLESATAIFNNHDLGTLNAYSQGSIVVNSAASQNITYTTTVTKTGSPQYEIHVRIEALG